MNNEFERMQRQRRKGLRVLLGALLIGTAVILAGVRLSDVAREGNEAPVVGRSPAASTAPSPAAPSLAQWPPLDPGAQVLARAAFYSMSAGERADMCAYMVALPKDAAAQAVREGFPPRGARALVRFIVEELC